MIQLTPEQQEQVRLAKQAGERRVVVRTTPDQDAEIERAIAEEDGAMEENKVDARQRNAALREPGFAGDLRRAIARSRRPYSELAGLIGVTEEQIDAFCAGDGELPSAAVSRLVDVLGLRLMAEIQ
jgi:DNA-binding MarR family transcriptional regulator